MDRIMDVVCCPRLRWAIHIAIILACTYAKIRSAAGIHVILHKPGNTNLRPTPEATPS